MSLSYYIPDRVETASDARPVPAYILKMHDDADDMLAEFCAEYEHNNRDGWESSWPLTFVFVRDGVEVSRYKVSREFVPWFHADRQQGGATTPTYQTSEIVRALQEQQAAMQAELNSLKQGGAK